MMKKTKRQLKLEQLRSQFQGMTDQEIRSFVPKVNVELTINKASQNIDVQIINCSLCGRNHIHGGVKINEKEYRVVHCDSEADGYVYPDQYELVIDWHKENNMKLKERYLQQLKDYERDPVGYTRMSTKNIRNYHEKIQRKKEEKLMYGYW